jgi:hypothetical protein
MIVTGNTYPGMLCVTVAQGRDARAHRTVYNTTLRQRRQGVNRHNKPFLRGQPNRKFRDRQLGPFTLEERIGKHTHKLKLPATVRLHHVLQESNLRPRSTVPLRPAVPMTILEGDDEEFDVLHIFVVCIKSLPRRRGKYLLFMTHFSDNDILPVRHRLNEVHRTTPLQDFLETPQWHKFAKTQAYIDFVHTHPTCIPESH